MPDEPNKNELRTLESDSGETPEQEEGRAIVENFEFEELPSDILNEGDLMVSKSGTRRIVKEIPDEKDPQKKFFKFIRIEKDGSETEEDRSPDYIDSKKRAIAYILTPDQQKRAEEQLEGLKREYAINQWGWDENIHGKLLLKKIEKEIYKEDKKKRETEER